MGPLRTVILYSTGHLGSAVVFNRLVESPDVDIVGVIRADPVAWSGKGVRRLRKHLRKVGWRFGWLLFWQRLVQAAAYGLARLWRGRTGTLSPGWVLAAERGIPVFRCRSVNEEGCRHFLAGLGPDLLVSAYFSQILAKETIRIPRLGVLNVHPGWLPAYRGAMCYFWVLREGEDRAGVSVHWIDEGIDTGEVVARRAFRMGPGATQQRVLLMSAVIGSQLLLRMVRRLAAGERLESIPIDEAQARYYPLPGEAEFDTYFAERRFFRIRDILGQFLRRFHTGRNSSRLRP